MHIAPHHPPPPHTHTQTHHLQFGLTIYKCTESIIYYHKQENYNDYKGTDNVQFFTNPFQVDALSLLEVLIEHSQTSPHFVVLVAITSLGVRKHTQTHTHIHTHAQTHTQLSLIHI